MMHTARCCLEDVPYCFSRSSVKFEGYTWPKIAIFDPNWAVPNCSLSLTSQIVAKWCTKLQVAFKRCPFVFKVIRQISRSHETDNCRFWPKMGASGLQFELTDGYEMMHKAWSGIEEVPYCFQGHPSNFKVTQDKKMPTFTQIEHFRTVTPVRIHGWLWNSGQSLT